MGVRDGGWGGEGWGLGGEGASWGQATDVRTRRVGETLTWAVRVLPWRALHHGHIPPRVFWFVL